MLDSIKLIKKIINLQKETQNNIKNKEDKFNKEWQKWGNKTTNIGRKMP